MGQSSGLKGKAISQGKAYFTSTLTPGQSIMMDFQKRKLQQL